MPEHAARPSETSHASHVTRTGHRSSVGSHTFGTEEIDCRSIQIDSFDLVDLLVLSAGEPAEDALSDILVGGPIPCGLDFGELPDSCSTVRPDRERVGFSCSGMGAIDEAPSCRHALTVARYTVVLLPSVVD